MHRVFVVTFDIGGGGGIERVAGMTVSALSGEVNLTVINIGSGKIARICRMIWLHFQVLVNRQAQFVFMHPRIFQYLLFPPKQSFVWAHGIDVWGSYAASKVNRLHRATKILTISCFTLDRLRENGITVPTVIVPLFSSMKPSGGNLGKAHSDDLSGRSLRCLCVARMSENERYKGHDLILEALSLLKHKNTDVRVEFVGGGDDVERLRNNVNSYELDDIVTFHGEVEDEEIESLLLRSDLYLMPSQVTERPNDYWTGEGLGIVYLEAAEFGLASIATNVGGQTDVVIDGLTGFQIEPTPVALCECLENLSNDKSNLRAVGKNARRMVSEKYNREQFKATILQALMDGGNECLNHRH